MQTAKTAQIHGTLRAFNISPNGFFEGLLVESKGDVLQINFAQELGQLIAELVPVNGEVHIEAQREERFENAAHPVYRMVQLKNSEGKTAATNGDGHFSGKVMRLNYALHGEANGAILDSGDFLHLKPHGAATLKLKAGMKVTGKGETKPMIGGRHVIEAEEVNGIPLHKKPKPRKKAAH